MGWAILQRFLSLSEKEQPLPLPFIKESSFPKTGVKGFQKDLRVYRDHFFEDLAWHPVDSAAVLALSIPPALFSSLKVKSSSHRTTQELRFCLWNDSTCGKKLCTMYLTRLRLSWLGVFLLVSNFLVTSTIKFFKHWNQLFFMSCFRAVLAVFHASWSKASPFERVYFRRVVRHSRRGTDNWSFLVRLCPRRGIEWSYAATSFYLVARTVSSNDLADFVQPSLFMVWAWIPRGILKACLCSVVLCSRRDYFFTTPPCVHWITVFLYAELDAPMIA